MAPRRAARTAPASAARYAVDEPADRAGQLAAAVGLAQASGFEQLAIHQDGTHALQNLGPAIMVAFG